MSVLPDSKAAFGLMAFLALAAMSVLDSWAAHAQQPPQVPERESEAQSIVRSMLMSREALRSGICLVHEEREYKKSSERDYRFVFDYSKELVRFERDDRFDGKTIYIGTPVDSFVYIPGNGHIDRHAPRVVPIIDRAMPFDLRRIGISGSGSFDSPLPFERLHRQFQSLKAEIIKRNPPERDDMVVQVNLISPVVHSKLKDGRTLYDWPRQVFYVDKASGNVAARYELFVRSSFEKGRLDLGTDWLDQTSETKWKEMGGTIVPTECLMVARPKSKMPSKTKLTFDWKSVNAPVDMAAFTVESLGAPIGTVILNHQSGKPVEQGRIGEKAKVPKL